MLTIWYICDGIVEEYRGQRPTWQNSYLVLAASPEDALLKLMRYHQRLLDLVEIVHDGRTILAIC